MNSLLKKLDLTSLRLFVAVYQEKNIARAAEREYITPSAVSRRISELEMIIGMPLIYRQSRGIAVTPVGETVYRYAQAMIVSIESLAAELSHFSSGAKGHVKLVSNMSAIVQFLPEDIAAFQRSFPDVYIDLEEHPTATVMRAVEENAADFGICNAVPGVERFQHILYRTDSLCLLVPHTHPLNPATRAAFADVLSEQFVGLRRESELSLRLKQAAADLGTELRISIRVSSLDALCRMVHAGLGIAVVPQQTAELYVSILDVKMVPLTDPWAVRNALIIFKQRELLSACAISLIQFLAPLSALEVDYAAARLEA